MKTLANCTPREFVRQTGRIRGKTADWLGKTRILEIRQKQPTLTEDMTKEEKDEAMRRQVQSNLNEMLDNMLGQYPDETAEILGLVCFIEPDDLDNHKMSEILQAVSEVISDREVLNFFISLMRLVQTDISPIAKA